jgi:hypothetical protein
MCVCVPLTSLFELVEMPYSSPQLREVSCTRSRHYVEPSNGCEASTEKVMKTARAFDL